eukprot:5428893-Pleurochrysis_carterae.AAC.1
MPQTTEFKGERFSHPRLGSGSGLRARVTSGTGLRKRPERGCGFDFDTPCCLIQTFAYLRLQSICMSFVAMCSSIDALASEGKSEPNPLNLLNQIL